MDPFAILGVNRDAPDDEVKRAWKRAVKLWHPDLCKAPDAADRFRQVQDAYELITRMPSRIVSGRTANHGKRWKLYRMVEEDDVSWSVQNQCLSLPIEVPPYFAADGGILYIMLPQRYVGMSSREVSFHLPPHRHGHRHVITNRNRRPIMEINIRVRLRP